MFERHAEFARASVQAILDSTLSQLHYLGFIKKESFGKVHNSISACIYEHWDGSSESGPATRPKTAEGSCSLGLKVLAMSSNGHVLWPEPLMSRFAPGTIEHQALEAKRAAFLEMYPESAEAQAAGGSKGSERSNARPDFTIEGGAKPLDVNRKLEITGVPAAEFTFERQGSDFLGGGKA